MTQTNLQRDMYDRVYKKEEFAIDLPDYKITNGKNISNKKILVLGAGTARDVKFLISHNEVWAVDFSATAVSYLKSLGIKALKADLAKPLPFGKAEFDLIVAKDILEHMENPSVLAGEIYRILHPSGYVVINVPNHFFLPMRLKMFFGGNIIWKTIDHDHTGEFEEWNYMHKIFFTWGGFQRFLKLNKLIIVKTFLDFGTLNHYSQPEMIVRYMSERGYNKIFTTITGLIWNVFNFLFPRIVRQWLTSLSPNLLCASFYVWCKPSGVRTENE